MLLLNRVENIVAKRVIAYYEQFLLLLQGFQKSSTENASKYVSCVLAVNVNKKLAVLCDKTHVDVMACITRMEKNTCLV